MFGMYIVSKKKRNKIFLNIRNISLKINIMANIKNNKLKV